MALQAREHSDTLQRAFPHTFLSPRSSTCSTAWPSAGRARASGSADATTAPRTRPTCSASCRRGSHRAAPSSPAAPGPLSAGPRRLQQVLCAPAALPRAGLPAAQPRARPPATARSSPSGRLQGHVCEARQPGARQSFHPCLRRSCGLCTAVRPPDAAYVGGAARAGGELDPGPEYGWAGWEGEQPPHETLSALRTHLLCSVCLLSPHPPARCTPNPNLATQWNHQGGSGKGMGPGPTSTVSDSACLGCPQTSR